eukprot:2155096-Amphidinium_carterae.1
MQFWADKDPVADLDESMSVVSRKRDLSPQSKAAESTTRRRVSGKSSVAGGSGPSASPWDRLVENSNKYVEQLNLRTTLEGKLNGHVLNQSLRVLEALQSTKPFAAEVVQLKDCRRQAWPCVCKAASGIAGGTNATDGLRAPHELESWTTD